MSRYLAADVYRRLSECECVPIDDGFDDGGGWVTRDGQPFSFPAPDEADGVHWFDADVMDYIAANRWLGFSFTDLQRHEPRPSQPAVGP